MSDTKRLLVHTANTFVPVSVIIVGVGRANKEKMKILDGDNRTLTSNEGVRAKRDIVQFVGESKNIYFIFIFFKFSDMEQTQKSVIETSKFPVRYNHDTDVPVEKIDPIECFYASVTRKRADNGFEFFPEQSMSREEAVYSYTLGNAFAAFEDDIKGSIEQGKYADFVVLSNDLITCSEEDILETEVLYTILNGEIVYSGI